MWVDEFLALLEFHVSAVPRCTIRRMYEGIPKLLEEMLGGHGYLSWVDGHHDRPDYLAAESCSYALIGRDGLP